MSLFPNRWHLRRVADTSTKACEICYKPSPWVLITADSKDFFYVCKGHLGDRAFCSPIVDQAAVDKAAAKAAQDREIEALKKEFEEKQRRKEQKQKKTEKKDKDKDKDKRKKDDEDDDDRDDEDKGDGTNDKDDKGKEKKKKNEEKNGADDDEKSARRDGDDRDSAPSPRIFALHKTFYQMRLDRLRTAEVSKRNRERLQSSSAFPAVPKGDP